MSTRPELGGEPVTTDRVAGDPLLREISGLLAYLDLHLGRYEWSKLTTREKELLADLVDADGVLTAKEDPTCLLPGDEPRRAPRWWREDYQPDER